MKKVVVAKILFLNKHRHATQSDVLGCGGNKQEADGQKEEPAPSFWLQESGAATGARGSQWRYEFEIPERHGWRYLAGVITL